MKQIIIPDILLNINEEVQYKKDSSDQTTESLYWSLRINW